MITENNIYYVYILFKTYKGGNFKYDDLSFSMEPFYVGKGKNIRIDQSKNVKKNKNRCKNSILEKIHSMDLTVTSIKFKENLTESEAFFLEMDLIKKIGRSDRNLGPLANLTDGGEGGTGGTSRIGDWPELYVPVLKYSLDGDLICEYQSIKKALSENPNAKNISYCCQLKRDTSGGFIWRYKDDKNLKEKINVDRIKSRTQKGNFKVKVIQKNLNGEIIKEYESIKEASEKTGCYPSKIVSVCKGNRKKTNGFIFEYKNDN
jgi:hypothetical protein